MARSAAVNATNAVVQAATQSRPGQILVNLLAAAGGEVTTKLTPLGYAADVSNITNAYITAPTRTDGYIAAASQASGAVAVGIAGKLGGPVGAGAAQAAVTAGSLYVAPWLGDKLYNAAPGLFTPKGQTLSTVPTLANAESMTHLLRQ